MIRGVIFIAGLFDVLNAKIVPILELFPMKLVAKAFPDQFRDKDCSSLPHAIQSHKEWES